MLRTTFRRFSAYIPREPPSKKPQNAEHHPDLTKMGNKMVAASYIKEKVDETINSVQHQRDKAEQKQKAMQNMEETTARHPTGKKVIPGEAQVNKLNEVDHREKSEAELKNDGTKLYD